jgi:20S proteasome subunit beta 1
MAFFAPVAHVPYSGPPLASASSAGCHPGVAASCGLTEGLKAGEVSTGTTIMACTFDGGVILAADSRTSTGSYIANRVSDKITSLSEHIYICRSGSAADTQAISDYCRHFLAGHEAETQRKPLVKTAATLLKTLCYQNKNNLSAGIIVAGWDPVYGGQVYGIPMGGTLVQMPWTSGGSGSTYIHALLDATYREGMAKEECIAFVRKGVAHAMSRDGSSGGIIRTLVIEASGVQRDKLPGNQLPYGP